MKCEEYEDHDQQSRGRRTGDAPPRSSLSTWRTAGGAQNFLRYLLKLRNAEAELATDETLPSGARALAQERQTGVRRSTDLQRTGIASGASGCPPVSTIAFVMLVLWTGGLPDHHAGRRVRRAGRVSADIPAVRFDGTGSNVPDSH